MKTNNYLIATGLVLILIALILSHVVNADIYESQGYSNGGDSSGCFQQWGTTGSNIMKFGTVNDSENYHAASYQFTTLGKSGYAKQITSGETFSSTMDISASHMLNYFETGAMADYQANVPDSICDTDLGDIGTGPSGKYPSSQSVDYLTGIMATNSSRYQSSIEIAGTTLTHDITATSKDGYYYNDLKGYLKAGFDKNSSDLSLAYGVHDHTVTRSNETAPLNVGFDYSWNGYEIVEPEEETYTVSSISSERLEKFVNATNTTAE